MAKSRDNRSREDKKKKKAPKQVPTKGVPPSLSLRQHSVGEAKPPPERPQGDA
jgi:hypothetical protein